MPIIRMKIEMEAPIERCFDLARSIDLHMMSTAQTRERAIAGVTTGLISMGEQVTWKAKHFGVWQTLTSKIVAYDRPNHFRDSMVSGAFRRFDHDHYFYARGENRTEVVDVFDFDAPFGLIGQVANRLFLSRYMTRLLERRNQVVRHAAESELWRSILPEE